MRFAKILTSSDVLHICDSLFGISKKYFLSCHGRRLRNRWIIFLLLSCILEGLVVSGVFSLAKNASSSDLELGMLIYIGIVVLLATAIRTLNSASASAFLSYVSTRSSNSLIDLILWKDMQSRDKTTNNSEISSITIELNNLLIMSYLPITNFISSVLVVASIAAAMFISDFISTLVALSFLLAGYSGIYYYTRRKATANSRRIYTYEKYILSMSMSFLSRVRSITLSQDIPKYEKRIKYSNKFLRQSQLANNLLAILPRSIVETIFLTSLLLVYVVSPNKSEGLAAIAGLAFGAQKLLPNIQFAYSNLVTIQGNKSSAMKGVEKIQISRSDVFQYTKKKNSFNTSTSVTINSIQGNDLSYLHPGSVKLIKYPDFELKASTITVLTGASGSGKSTLIDIVVGLRPPKTGSIVFNTVDTKPYREPIQNLWKNISIMEQVPCLKDTSLLRYLDPCFKHTSEEIDNALLRAGILNQIRAKGDIGSLRTGENGKLWSRGQIQRLALAAIILEDRDFIILDEPTSGLDKDSRELVYNVFKLLKARNKILLVVTHDRELELMADGEIRL